MASRPKRYSRVNAARVVFRPRRRGARRRAIRRLVRDRELSAGEIAAHFDVTRPAVSQRLRVPRDAELL
jgi:DNA-binding transcriptional ArsR family regulator